MNLRRVIENHDLMHFMGISLMSTPFFSKRTVRAYVDRFANGGSPFILLVADSLEFFNLLFLKNMPPQEAAGRARRVALGYLRGYQRIRHTHPNVRVVLTSQVECSVGFARCATAAYREYLTNTDFRSAVDRDVIQNLGDRVIPILNTGHTPGLQSYVIGEVAISLFMHSCAGPRVKVKQVSPRTTGVLPELGRFRPLLQAAGVARSQVLYEAWTPRQQLSDAA